MSNPAEELHLIFRGWVEAPQNSNIARRGIGNGREGLDRHIRAIELLGQIDLEIARLKQEQRRVGTWERAFPQWLRGTLAIGSGSWGAGTNAASDFDGPAMDALELLADALDNAPGMRVDPEGQRGALEMLEEVLSTLDEDTSLDSRLATHIRRVVRHLRDCVQDATTLSDELLQSLDAVWAAMQAAASTSSTHSTKWASFRDRLLVPVATGWAVSAPAFIQQITQS